MCGRYRRRSDKQRIAEAFGVGMGLEEIYLEPEEDIAPGSVHPVVLSNRNAIREIGLMRWGFKTPKQLLFNARSEGIELTNFWKESFLKRRCIVPADSFYEWEKLPSGKKQKFEFTVSEREPFGIAGIWASWRNPKTEEFEPTFAILTSEANNVMRPIHDRQPTILEPRDYDEWLGETDRPPLHLLRLLPDEEMRSKLVQMPDEIIQQRNLFSVQ